MTGISAALLLAGGVLFLTTVLSMIVAANLGGARRLPILASSDPPRRDPISVVLFGALITVLQLTVVGAGLAPNSIFTPSGSVILLLEPLVAIGWLVYLASRYRRRAGNSTQS